MKDRRKQLTSRYHSPPHCGQRQSTTRRPAYSSVPAGQTEHLVWHAGGVL